MCDKRHARLSSKMALQLRQSSLLVWLVPFFLLVLLSATSHVSAYRLSPADGQADIGAYHVQPGRCEGVERRLGSTRYGYFFRSSPFITSFTPPSAPSADDAGQGIEQMDATSLCAFNPELTEGYGGGFDNMRVYLVYSRCIYGTNDMRVLCGTTDGRGKPIDSYYNLVQASCPQGTKCKNLCATMRDPSLTSVYAAKQVQLAQCMPDSQWQFLTNMYRPKPAPNASSVEPAKAREKSGPQAAEPNAGTTNGKIDPKVVAEEPKQNPTKDQTHPDPDGTIPGLVLLPAAAGDGVVPHTTSRLQVGPNTPPTDPQDRKNSTLHPSPEQQQEDVAPSKKEQPQKAPTPMGFRKRSLHASSRLHPH